VTSSALLELRAVVAPPLNGAELEFGAGLHVALGSEADGAAMLAPLAAGLIAPQRGTLRVAGLDPRRSPEIRRRIGTLCSTEELFPARTIAHAVSAVLDAHEAKTDARSVLAGLGLAAWAARTPASLSGDERRSVVLALALGVPDPALLVLHEPLSRLPGIDQGALRERLTALSAREACIVCTTASARDAVELGGSLVVLDRGRFVRRLTETLPDNLAPGSPGALIVRTSAPARLAAELANESAVTGVDWDRDSRPAELRAHGSALAELALSVARAAERAQVSIQAIVPHIPELDVVRAASAGLSRAAWEQAERAAYDRAYPQHQNEQAPAAPTTTANPWGGKAGGN
jgi:ABC-2 type transport system ATP-binding protein